MSGIVGILNTDGEPVERPLLEGMTRSLGHRGPDGQDVWISAQVGFGHSMLRISPESEYEQQPYSFDGQTWVTADARIDGREELLKELESQGCLHLNTAPDVELIWHSYCVWGVNCVTHLMGDFAFAIWDAPRKRLFCARDHFGVKPFFYTFQSNRFVFSSTLNNLRLHPAVSDKLNDRAIGDFLLFGSNKEVSTTTFSDIQRLAPAHYLIWSDGELRLNRYWSVPTDGQVRYRKENDYVDHFKELLHHAVKDRLRTNRAAVTMSGGLDSPTVAAVAKKIMAEQNDSFELHAHTIVFDRLIPDQERYYAGIVAKAIGIPIHYLAADGYNLFGVWDRSNLSIPEPASGPLMEYDFDFCAQISSHSRVALTGYGLDAALSPSHTYLWQMLKRLRFDRLGVDLGNYLLSRGPRPPYGILTKLKRLAGKQRWRPIYPTWLNKEFERNLNLRARWEEIYKTPKSNGHPLRPESYQELTAAAAWQNVFEYFDQVVNP
ncbi:MAG: asparagine synthetase B, partial [Acidobacteria bacterium]|nr:asparagine synthetase B [Acidobacteriota bacterium]